MFIKKVQAVAILTFLVLLFIIACSKTDQSLQSTGPKIKSVNGFGIRVYDDKGRLRKIKTPSTITEYEYSDSIVTVMFNDLNDPVGLIDVYRLRSDGVAVFFQLGIEFALNKEYTLFTYSPSKTLVMKKDTSSLLGKLDKQIYYYTGNSSNPDSMRQFVKYNGNYNFLVSTTKFEYYTDKPNTLGNEAFGQSFLGVSSTNPVKKASVIYLGSLQVTDYTYEYDSQNRIIKRSVKSPNGTVTVTTYSYY